MDLTQGMAETLVGMVAHVDMSGFNLIEIQNYKSQDQLWVRGGFPNSLLAAMMDIVAGL